jgi:hypothetical protein
MGGWRDGVFQSEWVMLHIEKCEAPLSVNNKDDSMNVRGCIHRLGWLGSVVFALLFASSSQSSVLTITNLPAVQTGWYEMGGTSQGSSNYFVGDLGGEHRNFFVFNIPAVSGVVTQAYLRILNPESAFSPANPQLTYTLFDVTTPVSTLAIYGGALSTFQDLGSGNAYGSRVYSRSDNGLSANIPLNAVAIADINAHLGSSFAIGGAITPAVSFNEGSHLFGFSYTGVTLSLTSGPAAAPLPTAAWMGMALLAGLSLNRLRVGRRLIS